MSWQKDDDELIQHLKHLPDFPMKPQSKNEMLKELVRVELEQAIKPRDMHKHRARRALGTASASVAGLALFGAGIIGYSHLSSQRSALPNATTSKPPTATPFHGVQPTYFGYRVPFQPMIPTTMASGYKLANSYVYMTSTNGKVHFNSYLASYTNAKVPTSGRVTLPPAIDIYEAPGNSITQYQPVENEHVNWTKFAQIDNQTYYFSNPSIPLKAVGFVKNNVIYAVNEPMGGNISQSTLLKYAESITRVAPIQGVSISAIGYDNALASLSFRPFVPSTLYANYKLESASSSVITGSNGTTQSITLSFEMKNNPNKAVMVIEGPLNNADNKIPFGSDVVGYVPTWKDYNRGLELSLMGNTDSTEFHRVLSLFKMPK